MDAKKATCPKKRNLMEPLRRWSDMRKTIRVSPPLKEDFDERRNLAHLSTEEMFIRLMNADFHYNIAVWTETERKAQKKAVAS